MQTALEGLLNGSEYRRFADQLTDAIQKTYGLCKIDLFILNYLSQSEEKNTSTDILALHLFTRGHISQSINRLIRLGYLSTEVDTKDHRVVHCYLTEQVNDVLAQLHATMNKIETILFADVHPEQKEIFFAVAKQIHLNMMKELD